MTGPTPERRPEPGRELPRERELFATRSDLAGFVRVARASDVPDGAGLLVRAGGREIGLFRVDGAIHAIDDRCPHQYASLSEGYVCGEAIVCPLHGWRFDVRTGGPPGGLHAFPRVDRFDVRVEGDWVWLDPTPRRAAPAAGADPAGGDAERAGGYSGGGSGDGGAAPVGPRG